MTDGTPGDEPSIDPTAAVAESAPSAGAAKAAEFAQRVRIGHHLERLQALRASLGLTKERVALLTAELEGHMAEAAAIAEALSKERG